MLIGITGTLGAGKGTVVDYLVREEDFRHVSARSIWTRELEARNMPVNRDTMTALANDLRAEHGADYFMRLAIETVKNKHEHVVIESVRTMAEAAVLQEKGGILLAVDADIALRYKRAVGRASALDDVTFEQFIEQEARETENDDPNKQNLKKVMEMADFKIINNGSLEDLEEESRRFLTSARKASL